MNRELKFRVWNNKSKKFVYNLSIGEVKSNINHGLHGVIFDGEPSSDDLKFEDCITEQYIGLKDSYGRHEVYEGDIIELYVEEYSQYGDVIVDSPIYKLNGTRFKVIFGDGMFCYWNNGFKPLIKTHFEVVGNIHENPELLK